MIIKIGDYMKVVISIDIRVLNDIFCQLSDAVILFLVHILIQILIKTSIKKK